MVIAVRERVDALNERLDLVGSGEKTMEGELSVDGASAKLAGYSKKSCKYLVIPSMISHIIGLRPSSNVELFMC